MSVVNQSRELLVRSRYVRNAILAMQTAIGFFVLTSIAIGINLFISSAFLARTPMLIFVLGMLAVLVGIIHAAVEVRRSYRIVLLEVRAED
jgi:ABC-type siderophore export system fused ATPase/permease subunit